MSKCDLTIVLDRKDRRYPGGDKITGRVRVTVNDVCTCNALTISLGWRTHGRGNEAAGPLAEEMLFQGEWLPAKTAEYKFEFTAPDGPATYHGNLLNVDWYLKARADIPMAIDPKAEEEILLVPGPTPWVAPLPDDSGLHEVTLQIMRGNVRGKPLGCMLAFLVPFLLVGLGTLIGAFSGFGAEGDDAPDWMQLAIMLVIGIAFTAVFVLGFFQVAGKRIAARRLGPVELEVTPRSLCPGDKVNCRLRFTPAAGVHVNGIEMELGGAEVVVSGHGTNTSTHSHPLGGEVAHPSGPKIFPMGAPVKLEHTFTVPADAASSFDAPGNSIRWALTVRIKQRMWPTWKQSEAVVVHR